MVRQWVAFDRIRIFAGRWHSCSASGRSAFRFRCRGVSKPPSNSMQRTALRAAADAKR
jgi:hypothetical protein